MSPREAALDRIERTSAAPWLAGGSLGAALPLLLAASAATPRLADAALAAAALIGPALAGWGLRVRARLRGLPLEIGPVAATGLADGARIFRFRARLGRGRRLARPRAEVWFEAADGRVALPVRVPADELVGPFTLVATDPDGRCAGPGRFVVEVACDERGRAWSASRVIPRDAVTEGWFPPEWGAATRS